MTKNYLLVCIITALVYSLSALGDSPACWLDSYGRGVGTIPGRVADCPQGYRNMGLTCSRGLDIISAPSRVADCPSGYTHIGLACKEDGFWATFNPSSYLSTGSMTCPHGYFLNKEVGRCYMNCPHGYTSTGEVCTQDISILGPEAMSCHPDEYKGGIGNLRCYPKVGDCGADGEKDAGLCYKKCTVGYSGIGPVCWGTCPSSLPYSCGASCVKNAAGCAITVFSQVAAVGSLAATVATLGGSTAAKAAVDAPAQATQLSALRKTYDAMIKAYNSVKNSHLISKGASFVQANKRQLVSGVNAVMATPGGINFANSEIVTEADIIRVAALIMSIVDHSGVSDVVAAYSFPKCSTQFNAPVTKQHEF